MFSLTKLNIHAHTRPPHPWRPDKLQLSEVQPREVRKRSEAGLVNGQLFGDGQSPNGQDKEVLRARSCRNA